MLTAIGAIAEAFVTPFAPIIALALALWVRRPAIVRLVALTGGGLMGIMGHALGVLGELVGAALGSAAAWVLHAEIALHLVAPVVRWCWRCLTAIWEITTLAFAVARRHLRGAHADPPEPPRRE